MSRVLFFVVISSSLVTAMAAPAPNEQSTKFKKGKDMSFDSQLVEGQIYRPDLSVVTGDTVLGGTGVLRFRTDFADRALSDTGEVKP